MSIENESKIDGIEKERLLALADELDQIQQEKTGGKGDVVMQKLIRYLREENAYAAKVFISNESDKFAEYRGDAVPLIIEKLYDGAGSPWFSVERKMKAAKPESRQ